MKILILIYKYIHMKPVNSLFYLMVIRRNCL